MNVDSMDGMRIATDPQKVRPGMIYVDLSSRRNKREIYEAYANGAAIIFSQYNISDPELPVIKIKNIRDTLSTLYTRFNGKNGNNTRFIGVFGDGDSSMLTELMKSIIDYAIPVSIETLAHNQVYIEDIGFDCGIITDGGYFETEHGSIEAAGFLSSIFNNKTIIVNNDEPGILKAIQQCEGIIPVTYGLNKKANATASSIEAGEPTCFNYCVQKRFFTRSGKAVDPFEIPITLNALGNNNICNTLAAITLGLYYDVEINRIKDEVEGYKAPERHFQKVYEGDYTIIDNYCRSIHDYITAFEAVQILSYDNLILIISLSQKSGQGFHTEKAELVAEWVRMLRCKEVILTSCMDSDSRIGELPLKSIRIYKKLFKENDIPFRYYHLLQHAIDRSLSGLKKRDLLVLLGGDEMDAAQRLLKVKLQ